MGVKVAKFGGSSVADALQIGKIKNIIENDPDIHYVVVSAPGKRFSDDSKVTDLLYLCKAHIEHNLPYQQIFQVICDRFMAVEVNLGVNVGLKEEFEEYKKNGRAKTGHGGKIIVPYSFYEDLIEHDLYIKYKEKRKILIIQGDLDDTAPITDTYKFITNRPKFELIEMKNVKHHMEPDEISVSTEIMLKKLEMCD